MSRSTIVNWVLVLVVVVLAALPLVLVDGEFGGAEAEAAQLIEDAGGARQHAVPPAGGQGACEHLEDARAVCRAVLERRRQHGQLVVMRREECACADFCVEELQRRPRQR